MHKEEDDMNENLAVNGGAKAITLDQEEALRWPRLTEEDEQAVLELMRKIGRAHV